MHCIISEKSRCMHCNAAAGISIIPSIQPVNSLTHQGMSWRLNKKTKPSTPKPYLQTSICPSNHKAFVETVVSLSINPRKSSTSENWPALPTRDLGGPSTPQPLRRLCNLPRLCFNLCLRLSLPRISFYTSHMRIAAINRTSSPIP